MYWPSIFPLIPCTSVVQFGKRHIHMLVNSGWLHNTIVKNNSQTTGNLKLSILNSHNVTCVKPFLISLCAKTVDGCREIILSPCLAFFVGCSRTFFGGLVQLRYFLFQNNTIPSLMIKLMVKCVLFVVPFGWDHLMLHCTDVSMFWRITRYLSYHRFTL